MRLKSVKLSHLRGYHAATVIPIDEAMTGIVAAMTMANRPSSKPWLSSSRAATSRPTRERYELLQLDAEQFEIACEFDELPAVSGEIGTSRRWPMAG
jgi:hypothetical protein